MYHFHIADDHPLFRDALKRIMLQHFPRAHFTESSDLESTMKALTNHPNTDLLLLDLHMPGCQDLFGLITVREKYPSIPVSVVTSSESESIANRALAYGASGYIPKSIPPEQIGNAIDNLTKGKCWVPDSIHIHTSSISEEEKTLTAKLATLTPQQYRVLCYIREGWLNKQIAYELTVTEATIKAHVTAIFRKLGVSNRTQAVVAVSHLMFEKDEEETLNGHLATNLRQQGMQTSGTHRLN